MKYKLAEITSFALIAGKQHTLHSVEVWKKQCCGKPEVKITSVAFFQDIVDARKFMDMKNAEQDEVEANAAKKVGA